MYGYLEVFKMKKNPSKLEAHDSLQLVSLQDPLKPIFKTASVKDILQGHRPFSQLGLKLRSNQEQQQYRGNSRIH